MFVVYVQPDHDCKLCKVFSELPAATTFAAQQAEVGYDAKVYKVAVTNDHRAAKAALEMGEAELVFVPTRKPSDHEIVEARKREVLRQWRER
jgi:hypothetical protein